MAFSLSPWPSPDRPIVDQKKSIHAQLSASSWVTSRRAGRSGVTTLWRNDMARYIGSR